MHLFLQEFCSLFFVVIAYRHPTKKRANNGSFLCARSSGATPRSVSGRRRRFVCACDVPFSIAALFFFSFFFFVSSSSFHVLFSIRSKKNKWRRKEE